MYDAAMIERISRAMGNQSDVNIDAVATFGTNVLTNILTDYAEGTGAQASKTIAAIVGACGTNEAQTFRDWYNQAVCDSLGQHFMADSTAGLQAHGYAAVITASNYRHGDVSQSQQMDAVNDAFNPQNGQESIQSDMAQNKSAPPVTTNTNQLPPAKQNTTAGPPLCQEESPQQQYNEHQQRYGQNEHWHPEDPNQPYDPPIAVGPT